MLQLFEDDNIEAFSVGELAWQIKRVLESDPILSDVAVEGEISAFKPYSSGHIYLTLKDQSAQVRAIIWRKNVEKLAFRPKDGDRVIATGHVEFYGQRGEVSFIVDTLRFAGQGALFESFEKLKLELANEGLFDNARKKTLPYFPSRIGLITSPSGAVAHDVLNVLRRRWPLARVLFIPAKVQGFDAAQDLARALTWASLVDDLDVVIIGRGGGSPEDLWAFNDEDLAREAARFPFPLVSAVGHETDFTILDLVADVRAPTPSAAAELVVPNQADAVSTIANYRTRLANAIAGDVELARQKLNGLRARRVLARPHEQLEPLRAQVQMRRNQARESLSRRVKIEKQSVTTRRAQLQALDPQRVLERGYALVSDAKSGRLLSQIEDTRDVKTVAIALRDGTLKANLEN